LADGAHAATYKRALRTVDKVTLSPSDKLHDEVDVRGGKPTLLVVGEPDLDARDRPAQRAAKRI
jgi:hypothetical protein